jgi:hypothetical protein
MIWSCSRQGNIGVLGAILEYCLAVDDVMFRLKCREVSRACILDNGTLGMNICSPTRDLLCLSP